MFGRHRTSLGKSEILPKEQKKLLKEQLQQQKILLRQLERQSRQQNSSLKKRALSTKAPKTAQRTIRYRALYEDGICDIGNGWFSKSIEISDINYQIAKQDDKIDIFSSYCEVLNSLSGKVQMQISIQNRKIDLETFERTMFLSRSGDALDHHRDEMNQMLGQKVREGQNNILNRKYVTFSVRAEDYTQAIPILARQEAEIIGQFRSLGCSVQTLSGAKRVALLHDTLRRDPLRFSYNEMDFAGLTTKDYVAPDSFDFSLNRSLYGFGDEYGAVLYIQQFPRDMHDQLIKDLSEVAYNLDISIHILPVEQVEAIQYVKRKRAYMEQHKVDEQKKALKGGYDVDMIPYDLRERLYGADEWLADLEKNNQRMFRLTFVVATYAKDPATLQDQLFELKSIAQRDGCTLGNLTYLQEEGLNAILPIGRNDVPIDRLLTTASTAIFVPFSSQEIYETSGMYYGVNVLTRHLIFCDRLHLKNASGFILGTPGSGKSFAAKREMINVLLKDPSSEVIVLDPEREYTSLAAGFDGEIVHISAGSQSHINPFDITLDYADGDDPLLLKTEFILSLCDILLGGNTGLNATQKSVIDRACKLTYESYFLDNTDHVMPTLSDFYQQILRQPEPEAKSIALSLEIYAKGSLSTFAHPTNVNTSKRFVVYDIRDLGKSLNRIGMLIVMDQIWNRITRNRSIGKRTWIYIDELQMLFQAESSARYFSELWSRARKWGAIPTGITQNVDLLLTSDLARSMLSNAEFLMMQNQAAPDRGAIADLLNISTQQLSLITNAGVGQGLIRYGAAVVPFEDSFDRSTTLYKMMTTKLEEVHHA